jgi:hypothetical protein
LKLVFAAAPAWIITSVTCVAGAFSVTVVCALAVPIEPAKHAAATAVAKNRAWEAWVDIGVRAPAVAGAHLSPVAGNRSKTKNQLLEKQRAGAVRFSAAWSCGRRPG